MPRPRGESAPPSVDSSLGEELRRLREQQRAGPGTLAAAGSARGLGPLVEEDDESPATPLRPPPRDQFLAPPQPKSQPPHEQQQQEQQHTHSRRQHHQHHQHQQHQQEQPAGRVSVHAAPSSPTGEAGSGAPAASRRSGAKDLRHPAAIANHYDVAFTIGEGAFAKVKIASHKLTGVRVAVKIIYKARLIRDNELFRAYDEVEVLKRLRHKNIVRLYQVVDAPDRLYLVMEYLPNGELFDYIVANDRIHNEKDAKWIFYQAIKAVHHCHTHGVAHRDLKPVSMARETHVERDICTFRPSASKFLLLLYPRRRTCSSASAS
jgi:hypothetical protein